ncbi:response regulator transcription factor [Rhizobacter sp. Root1221]|uniref:response regulator transcription factor n=1 Tax=Rhizobacter sp. Root1221 TaxID=1736433 RepID=UPI0006F86E4E|nr:response regulator transcription factor [Rhizobacter sp. Root1221]KQV95852.1 LuxR family transcriptional regulator [Rhizobacter sp. Root1221]
MTDTLPDRSASDLVLVVDDVPDNLSVLHDALDEAGYTVLVATNGEGAIQRAVQAVPDIVLLDAMMPGMDGFEVARQLKARPETAHIPIIFMTGLTETEHVVAAYRAGGVDYVTKPIRPQEVLARMTVHMQSARQARQARNALDAFGHATMAIHADDALTAGKAVWQTPLARELMQRYFDAPVGQVPEDVLAWLRSQADGDPKPLTVTREAKQLVLSLQQRTTDDDWLVVMREVSDAAVVQALLQAFRLTMKEAEVLYWVAKGKTNRDIGDILGSSPATVKKHLEHVFEKLGVETRNAAASLAIGKVRLLA